MNVDPVDDCTFWYVNEYVPTTSSVGWRLRIGAFKFDECGTPDFYLGANPSTRSTSAPARTPIYDITVGSVTGFTNPVTLSATGNPAGTTTVLRSESGDPARDRVTFTIGNTGSAAPGSYVVTVSGAASGQRRPRPRLDLNVFNSAPGASRWLQPVDGALNQPLRPAFEWTAATQAAAYTLEVATDAAFSNVVYTTTVPGTTATPNSDLAPTPSTSGGSWRPTPAAPVRRRRPVRSQPWLAGDCGTGTIP